LNLTTKATPRVILSSTVDNNNEMLSLTADWPNLTDKKVKLKTIKQN